MYVFIVCVCIDYVCVLLYGVVYVIVCMRVCVYDDTCVHMADLRLSHMSSAV